MGVKQELLALLEGQRGEVVSGAGAAKALGVSRAAVWKAVEALRAEGLPVEAVKGSGYRLSADSDMLSPEAILAFLPDKDTPVRVLEETTSTNTEAKQWAMQGAGHGALVVAQRQVAGKGRLGRGFVSPPGGLYMSVVLRPPAGKPGLMRLTAAAAVAACQAVSEKCGKELSVKWVNDLFYEGKKVCGILTEGVSSLESGGFDHLVVGIGINYLTPGEYFTGELGEVATSLFPQGSAPLPRAGLAAAIHTRLLALFEELAEGGFLAEYRRRSLVLGRRVTVLAQPPYEAQALDIDGEARLLVQRDDGSEALLSAGEISVKLS